MKKLNRWLCARPIVFCLALALVLTVAVEMLNRRSIIEGVGFFLSHPVIFGCNFLVILLTLFVSLFFRRRIFVLSVASIFWLGMAITNFIVLHFRTTPLAAIDFYILKPVFSILKVYINLWQAALICVAFLLVLIGVIAIFVKAPKHKAVFKGASVSVATAALFAAVMIPLSVQAEAASDGFANLANAYKNYGFAYCFTTSFLDNGIGKPADYSEEAVADILRQIKNAQTAKQDAKKAEDMQKLNTQVDAKAENTQVKSDAAPNTANATKKPNVIFLQLESFIDPNRLEGFSYSSDPVPVFTGLKKNFSSGYLEVPSIGAGTANTEFELLTGMSLDYFGPGEYPYKTILQQKSCETIAYNLKENGYGTHAIHNNFGSFYDRHLVFPNLGFDRFTSVEYMEDVPRNELGWAKDSILTEEIFSSLATTASADFVYAISVQPHGKYPGECDENLPIAVSSTKEVTESELAGYRYYLNQIHEVDAFVGDLLKKLEQFDEPTVLVIYGDHFPSIGLTEQYLEKGDALQSEYVIWSNFAMDKEDRDLACYQLGSAVLERIGIGTGTINALHQNLRQDSRYLADLEILSYDALYGKGYLYDGKPGYAPTDMIMGSREVRLTGAVLQDGYLYVTGKGFTPYSVIYIEDSAQKTEFISSTKLRMADPKLREGKEITVAQVGEDSLPLSYTGTLWFGEED